MVHKKIQLIFSVILTSFYFFCVDPISEPPQVTSDKVTVTFEGPGAKKNGFQHKIGDLVTVKIKIVYANTIDTLYIDYGEPKNINNLEIVTTPTSSSKEYIYPAKITYQEVGTKVITAKLKFKNNFNFPEKKFTTQFNIGMDPKIKENLIKCSPDFIYIGLPCTLSVDVSEYGTVEYRWERNNSLISEATGKKYVIPSISNMNTGKYKCHSKNEFGTDETKEFDLSISTTPKPLITQHPQDQQVTLGKSTTFKCIAVPENVKYQWFKNNTLIPNQTNTVCTLLIVSMVDNNARFKCKVSNEAGTVESNESLLKVFDEEQKPSITKQPLNTTVSKGEKALFSVETSGTNLVFQWQKNGADISNTNSNVYLTNPVSEFDNATKFRCKISNSAGSDLSSEAILTVLSADEKTKPQIIQEPANLEVSEGSEAIFQVVAYGKNLKYQWKCNGNEINGEINEKYKILEVKKSDNGSKYKCEVSNAFGTITTREATLKIVDKIEKISIIKQPENQVVKKGERAKFTVVVSGTNPQYQWYKNGVAVTGANLESYTTDPVEKSENNTKYKCVITNSLGSVTSDETNLSVHYIEVTKQPQDLIVEVGKNAKFSVEVSANPNPLYQWLRNGSEISGATSDSYTRSDIILDDNNSEYSCRIKLENSQVTVMSQVAKLLVKDGPITINTHPRNQKIKLTESATFSVEASGSNLKYQWTKNGIQIGTNEKNLHFIPEKTDNNATIKCAVSNSSEQKETNNAILTVEWLPIINMHPRSSEANEGANVTFSIGMSDEGNPKCTYQWYYNGSMSQGSTNKILQFIAKKEYNNSTYYCKVKNSVGEIQSQSANLQVHYLNITQQPLNPGEIAPNASVTLNTQATGNPSSINYNWTKEDVSIGNSSSITFTVNELDNGKKIQCVASNGKLTVKSNIVTLTVKKQNTPPKITQFATRPAMGSVNSDFEVFGIAEDAESQQLSWDINANPSGYVTFSQSNSGQISSGSSAKVRGTCIKAGTVTLTFKISDGERSVTENLSFEISEK